jgi:hypothetical protein
VYLLIPELNNASVNYFFKSKIVYFDFDSHVAESVKVCGTTSLFDKMQQTAVNPATNKTYTITLHCRTLWEPNLFCIDRENSCFVNTVVLVFIQRN